MAEEGGGEGFLARWSRRKREAREPAPDVPEAPAAAPQVVPAPEVAPPEPEIDLASLPRIEDLTIESDITAFLRKGVPAALRNAALRRAWSLDPTIRDFIGPADYAWDWNVPGGVPGYVADIASGPDVDALADRLLGIVRQAASPPKSEAASPPGSEAAPPAAEAAAPREEPSESHPVPASVVRDDDPPGPVAQTSDDRAAPQRDPKQTPITPRPRHGGAVPG